jgi:hypothetical protein
LFDGEIDFIEEPTAGTNKYLQIKKLLQQEYIKNPIILTTG